MKKIWTKEKIKKVLLKEYKKNNYITLSYDEIKKNKFLPNPLVLYNTFGKGLKNIWEEIEEEEGITLNYRKDKNIETKISKELIIERTKKLHQKLGKVPTLREYKKEYGFNQISNKFKKGYIEVLFEANLIEKWKFGMSKEEMISYLQQNIDNEKILTIKDLKFNREFPTLKIIYNTIGCNSLNELKQIIDRDIPSTKKNQNGYKSIKNKSNEKLMKEYKLLCEKLGKVANGREITENLGYSSNSFIGRFGTLKILRDLLGYEHTGKGLSWTKEEIKLKLLEEYKKNNNRRLKVREIEINNNLPSLNTIKNYFGTKKISDIWDEIL